MLKLEVTNEVLKRHLSAAILDAAKDTSITIDVASLMPGASTDVTASTFPVEVLADAADKAVQANFRGLIDSFASALSDAWRGRA